MESSHAAWDPNPPAARLPCGAPSRRSTERGKMRVARWLEAAQKRQLAAAVGVVEGTPFSRGPAATKAMLLRAEVKSRETTERERLREEHEAYMAEGGRQVRREQRNQ